MALDSAHRKHNAGEIGAPTPIEAASGPLLTEVFAAIVLSMFFCCREATPRMSRRLCGKRLALVMAMMGLDSKRWSFKFD